MDRKFLVGIGLTLMGGILWGLSGASSQIFAATTRHHAGMVIGRTLINLRCCHRYGRILARAR